MLEELQGTMNDSIRVLKCVTHEENVWFLIEENLEYEDNPPQYWIKEIDLSSEEKEYLYQYLPLSMKEEDVLENDNANKQLKIHSDKFKELWDKRKEMLKELREIRFGLKVSCYWLEGEFDDDKEQKLLDYEIKFIEFEHDITFLNEHLQEQTILANEMELKATKYLKRIEELNGVIANLSKGASDTIDNFLRSYKNNELMYRNKLLQDEIDSKNEEVESMKNTSPLFKPLDLYKQKTETRSESKKLCSKLI